jgi:hypothetical protein
MGSVASNGKTAQRIQGVFIEEMKAAGKTPFLDQLPSVKTFCAVSRLREPD